MKIAILGAGMTGLTAAWSLSKEGHQVRVLECSPRLGGNVRTESSGGWLCEAGPNSFQEGSIEVVRLIEQLGLTSERITTGPHAKKRFLMLDGKLVAAPAGPGAFFSTPLFSLGTKLKILSEVALSARQRPEEVSVSTFIADHFGRQVVDRAVQPFIGGIYAGDADRLSAQYAFPKLWEAERTKGSIIRAALAGAKKRKAEGLERSSIISFRHGLQVLPNALAAHLPGGSIELGADVEALSAGASLRWCVTWQGPAGARSEDFDFVIATVPAWSLARLKIGKDGKQPLAGLSEVEYSPVSSLFLGYERKQVSHPLDGFGALVPSAEKRSVLGLLFSSSLFEGRAPEGHVALTAFSGGALQPDLAKLPQAELVARISRDLKDLVGAEGSPVFVRHYYWPRAIPQYTLGYGRHLDCLARCEADYPGLMIGGSIRDGIALPDCIKAGQSLAKRVS